MDKKLTKSQSNKMLCGICGGIGEYFNIDPTIVRIGFAILTLFAWIGVLAYIAFIFIIPEN